MILYGQVPDDKYMIFPKMFAASHGMESRYAQTYWIKLYIQYTQQMLSCMADIYVQKCQV